VTDTSNEEIIRTAYRECFTSKSGELVLNHLMETFDFWRSTYSPGQHDESLIREGGRNVVLLILALMREEKSREAVEARRSAIEEFFRPRG